MATRKRAEEALSEGEARFKELVEMAPDTILMVDGSGVIRFANSRTHDLLGYSPAELLGKPIEVLVPERLAERHVAHRENYAKHPQRRPMGIGLDLIARRKDGTEVPVDISLSPVETDAGLHVIAFVRDISERKRAMEELARRNSELKLAQQVSALKDHVLSTVSHELKTPLSLILGNAELLEDRSPEDPLVKGILDGTRRLSDQLNDILEYNALISGSLPLFKGEVLVAEVVDNAVEIVKEAFQEKGIRLVSSIPDGMPPVEADFPRLLRMLLKLLDNARKFTSSGGTVTISAESVGNRVRLSVEDTGKGIPEQERAEIWKAFSQLERGDAVRHGGMGLGLAIVKALATLHGGDVSVESEVGKGSRFSIWMPVVGQPQGDRG